MKSLKELRSDPAWMALHRKAMAQRNAARRQGKFAARFRASGTNIAVDEIEKGEQPGGRKRGPGLEPATFEEAVNDLVADGLSRRQATLDASKRYPHLREQAVARSNRARLRRRY